jgi:YfiH family protein
MGFLNQNGLRYYQFDQFDAQVVTHAIFTRRGGTSPKPWDSLNMGNLVGDGRERVEANRRMAFQALGRDPASMYDVWQVHSARVVQVSTPKPVEKSHVQADGMLTDQPGVTLFMRFADCVPILLFDPLVRVVGVVHAGWRGTVQKIASIAVQEMVARYGSHPADIQAGIGPSISVGWYEVGEEVKAQVAQAFGAKAERLLPTSAGRTTFDLWEANRILLTEAGLEKIEISGVCTASHPEDWFSYRAEGPPTGRFGVLIGLKA